MLTRATLSSRRSCTTCSRRRSLRWRRACATTRPSSCPAAAAAPPTSRPRCGSGSTACRSPRSAPRRCSRASSGVPSAAASLGTTRAWGQCSASVTPPSRGRASRRTPRACTASRPSAGARARARGPLPMRTPSRARPRRLSATPSWQRSARAARPRRPRSSGSRRSRSCPPTRRLSAWATRA